MLNGVKKQPRYPYRKYKHLSSEAEVQAFVDRLNHDLEKKKAIRIKSAFIPVPQLEEFRERLLTEIPNAKDAKYLYGCLHRYAMAYFVSELKVLDPMQWHEHQSKWGMHLLSLKLSAKSLRHIIQVTNRFLAFMKAPALRPLTKARLKEHEAKHRLENEAHPGLYLQEVHWAQIRNEAIYCLMYNYGLRRAEALALKPEDVRQGYLSVERQYGNKPLKGRSKRKTPHWFASPAQCHAWIMQVEQVHPDTLYLKFKQRMLKLKLPYQLHDLRRTFITRALDEHSPLQVQLAVGHTSINTTMKYVRDNRELEDSVFKPSA